MDRGSGVFERGGKVSKDCIGGGPMDNFFPHCLELLIGPLWDLSVSFFLGPLRLMSDEKGGLLLGF